MASGHGANVRSRLPRGRIARYPHEIGNMSANRLGPLHVPKMAMWRRAASLGPSCSSSGAATSRPIVGLGTRDRMARII